MIAQAYGALLKEMQWKSFTVLYEDNDGLIRLQEVLKSTSQGDIPITVRQIPKKPDEKDPENVPDYR